MPGYKQQNDPKPKVKDPESIVKKDGDKPEEKQAIEIPEGAGDEVKSLLHKLSDQNDYLVKELETQKLAIKDQKDKVEYIIGKATDLFENPQKLIAMIREKLSQPNANQSPPESNNSAQPTSPQPNQTELLNQAKQEAVQSVVNTKKINPALNMESITQLVNAIAVISSNFGANKSAQPASPASSLDSIRNGIKLVTQMTGMLGEGLSGIFSAFNKMEDRSYRSWQNKAVQRDAGLSKDMLKDAIKDIILESKDNNEVK